MSQALDLTLGRIDKVAQEIGLAELSRRSDVPVSTLHDWQKEDWRPRTIRALGKVSAAADVHLNPEVEA